jgi:hypothetical protein
MRGSIDPGGNVVGGINVSNKTYAIDIPILTNAPMDMLVRCDASAVNTLLKLDGGVDLNFQMGLGYSNSPTALERRDNRPGEATDVFLGYEQSALQLRYGPEKFAARLISRDNATSLGAETYYYTVGTTTMTVINGSGNGTNINTSTAAWVYHDPTDTNTVTTPNNTATQRVPLNPSAGQSVDVYVKVGYKFYIDRCYLYFTTDGSNPEGSFGVGKGTTQVVAGNWVGPDSADSTIDWWKATIPASAQTSNAQVRYKIALFNDNIGTISDADNSKLYGLTQAAITNFDPTAVTVWLHNDRNTNSTITGLREGFHIVRARTFLPRSGKSSVYNTFLQTFYYDAGPPSGVFAYPVADGNSISNNTYGVVLRADSSVTTVEFNIQDGDPNNDDALTGQNNGNGNSNSVPKFVAAAAVSPDATLSQLYPNFPQEFRFNYALVPTSGSGTITVRMRKVTTGILTNRVTTLTRTVNTFAPGFSMQIVNPSTEGGILVLNTNDTFLLQTCLSNGLTNNASLFTLYINGVLQPNTNYIFLGSGCTAGQRSLYYYWNSPPPGTNTIQVGYSNFFTLSDTRHVVIVRPGDSDGDGVSDYNEILCGTDPYDSNSVLRITELLNGNQLIWDSATGRTYQVMATTNLTAPFAPISPPVPASGASTYYTDGTPDPTNKFYRIQLLLP